MTIRARLTPVLGWAASSFAVTSLIAGSVVLGSIWATRSLAVVLGDGRIAFNSPPLMVRNSVTPSNAGARNATYRFAIAMPGNAGEPLSYVEIVPFAGPETIDFRLNAISAYAGDGIRRGEPIPVIGRSLDSNPSNTRAAAIGVQFDPPLAPGETATIVLKSRSNPSFGGSFAYEVTAYPDIDVGVSHRMGLARFTIHSGNGCDRVRC